MINTQINASSRKMYFNNPSIYCNFYTDCCKVIPGENQFTDFNQTKLTFRSWQ